MRPWIAVAYSAPVAAATAVFIIYPIGQGSFSDGMPLGKIPDFAPHIYKDMMETLLNGEPLGFIALLMLCISILAVLTFSLILFKKRKRLASTRVFSVKKAGLLPTPGGGKKRPTKKLPVELQEKGLKSLANPVLTGSFSLVLTREQIEKLDAIAKKAWLEIWTDDLYTATPEDQLTKTTVLSTNTYKSVLENTTGVYVVKNVQTGESVIGQTTNLKNRFNQYSARTNRESQRKSDNINRALHVAVKETGLSFSQAFHRYVVYTWEPFSANNLDIANELNYLEHRLTLAFFECGLSYNTFDVAPKLNISVPVVDISAESVDSSAQSVE